MGKLRFFTAGESHGTALIGIIEGIPANLPFSSEEIDRDLKRRQGGFGRGGRMKIESDRGKIVSGIRWGRTIGSPLAIMIENRDFSNWMEGMSVDAKDEGSIPQVTRPRPGHADLAGALKYNQRDIRNILERSSARETAMRVALGAVAKRFLADFGISIGSYVTQIGNQKSEIKNKAGKEVFVDLFRKAEISSVRCPDERTSERMVALIEKAIREGDSLGGVFEVFAIDVPIGVGSHVQWDRRIDGRLAQAIMSIQAIKGVEIGLGFEMAGCTGSEAMDEISYEEGTGGVHARRGFYRKTNNAGGIEGGMTNGMPIFLRAAMKPIPTLKKPLRSVDIITKEPFEAAYERSDVCAVPAASIVGEAMTALVLTDAFLEKFGGDSMEEIHRNYAAYKEHLARF
jgi:chorismate synthase